MMEDLQQLFEVTEEYTGLPLVSCCPKQRGPYVGCGDTSGFYDAWGRVEQGSKL